MPNAMHTIDHAVLQRPSHVLASHRVLHLAHAAHAHELLAE